MKFLSFLAALGMLVSAPAWAHPVSYQGAIGIMTWNQPFMSDHWVTYSFRNDMAIAARAMRMLMPEGEFRAYFPQLDYLLKRWNRPDYQSNIYLYGGFGGVWFQNQTGTGGMAGIEADAESRKYYISGKVETMRPSLGPNFNHAEARVGIAPYEAEFDEIASWFMIQGQYHPSLAKDYVITPLARFFYKNVLWEMGASLDGDYMLNFMFHL